MAYSIIICSRNIANLTACIAALRASGKAARVIVVWDHGTKPEPCVMARVIPIISAAGPPPDYCAVEGSWPFSFSRNCNIGIRAAGDDSVVLLNDDALLGRNLGGLEALALMPHDYGIVGATTNVTAYSQQRRRSQDDRRMFREVPLIAFVCVYIPRRTIEKVGLLDERFTSYGGEDVDYCLRVREAGLKVGVGDYCFVDHSKLTSTFRGSHPTNSAPGNCAESDRIGREKWGPKWPNGRHG